MNRQIKIILAGILLSISSLAIADDTFNIENPYIQAGFGMEAQGEFASKLAMGIDLTEHIGIELGTGSSSKGSYLSRTTHDFEYLSIAAKHKLSDSFTLIGKLGGTSWGVKKYNFFSPTLIKDAGSSYMVGAEVKYDWYKQLAVVFSLEYFAELDTIPATVNFRYTF